MVADVFLIKDGMTLVIFEIGNLVSPPSVNSRGMQEFGVCIPLAYPVDPILSFPELFLKF